MLRRPPRSTLSLHDALPILAQVHRHADDANLLRHRGEETSSPCHSEPALWSPRRPEGDRKSTRLNSSHVAISYAVFCLKKKKNKYTTAYTNYKHHIRTDVIY